MRRYAKSVLFLGLAILVIGIGFQAGSAAQGVEGHEDVLTTDQPATCYEAGLRIYTCMRCGRTRTVHGPPAMGHNYVRTTDRAPSCEEPGLRVYTCTHCGHTRTYPGGAALGHNDRLTTDQAPTCEVPGSRIYTCTHCGRTRTVQGAPALGHDYVLTVQDPTCEEPGLRTYTCSRCGDTYTEPGTPRIPHAFGEWMIETPPDVDYAGLEVRICTLCGVREERLIPPVPWEPPPPPPPPPPPLFNEVDIIAGGVSVSLILLFLPLIIPIFLVISREKKAHQAYLARRDALEREDKKRDFH
ncbi:MAG: hypothetical protein FWD84_05615 [Oscillospiraceae bacterium]|nr:hypothetical protein [Oscillospiraceae bacterium]